MALKSAKVIENKKLTKDVFEITFQTVENIQFTPGQFITIKINDGNPTPCLRAYSIASKSTSKNNNFSLIIKIVPNGRGSNWLDSLKNGDEINFIGPNGKFILENFDSPTLFIATGTGLAPFLSILETELELGNKNKFDLIFGVRHEEDLFKIKLLKQLSEKHENFNFQTTLSKPNQNWKGNQGRVTKIIPEYDFDREKTHIYICGLNAMIESSKEVLLKLNVPEENIHSEKYD